MRRELSTAIGGAEITVSTGGKLFARFGKALGKNAAALAAMVALGYALPKEAGPYINYAFDAWAANGEQLGYRLRSLSPKGARRERF